MDKALFYLIYFFFFEWGWEFNCLKEVMVFKIKKRCLDHHSWDDEEEKNEVWEREKKKGIRI